MSRRHCNLSCCSLCAPVCTRQQRAQRRPQRVCGGGQQRGRRWRQARRSRNPRGFRYPGGFRGRLGAGRAGGSGSVNQLPREGLGGDRHPALGAVVPAAPCATSESVLINRQHQQHSPKESFCLGWQHNMASAVVQQCCLPDRLRAQLWESYRDMFNSASRLITQAAAPGYGSSWQPMPCYILEPKDL